MQPEALNLNFKGDRTYIQGGDIYNAVVRIATRSGDPAFVSSIAFRHFARHDCDVVWDKPAPSDSLVAQGRIAKKTADQAFWVMESTRPASGRVDFDEQRLLAPAVSHGEEIVLERRSGYTPIEEIIALTKRLNYELAPDIPGKWVFGQLNAKGPFPDDYSSLAVRRTAEVPRRFSVNRIVIDGAEAGDIRFIVGNP